MERGGEGRDTLATRMCSIVAGALVGAVGENVSLGTDYNVSIGFVWFRRYVGLPMEPAQEASCVFGFVDA